MRIILRGMLLPVVLLLCQVVYSQTSVLLKNINQTTTGVNSSPTKGIWMGSNYYFSANDGFNGVELWKSDGSAGGTSMLKDISFGNSSSTPSNFTIVGTTLFFTANDGVNGSELWKTDGTTEGTVMVRDIHPGLDGSGPGSLCQMASLLVFYADDGVTGGELWKSDGTTAGTIIIKEIVAGPNGSGINRVISTGTKVFFSASANALGNYELFVTDGSAAGTGLIKEINPSTTSGGMGGATFIWGETLYFAGDNGTNGLELWKSDGTTAGTVMVKDMYPGGTTDGGNPQSFAVMNGKLYFYGTDANGPELWVSNGISGGTFMVKDINTGSAGSSPSRLTVIGTTLYFRATNGSANGVELWKSDGTTVGTVMVKDINTGTGSSNPDQLVVIGTALYFSATDNVNGVELWTSNGISSGTVMVTDINTTAAAASTPTNVVSNNNIFLFGANNGISGVELWRSDGSTGGTVLVKNINPDNGASLIANMKPLGNMVIFTANDGINGNEIWGTDGTAAGTILLKDINTATAGASSNPTKLTAFAGNVYFAATNGATSGLNGTELWKTDGTVNGTMMVKDINPGTGSSSPTNFVAHNGYLYFGANDGVNGGELWRTDGTSGNTVLVKDIVTGIFGSSPGSSGTYPDMISNGSVLFFTAINQSAGMSTGWELYSSTGAVGSGALLKDINTGPLAANSAPTNYVYPGTGNTVYFTAIDESTGEELWKSDGTASGTVLVKDINPGTESTSFNSKIMVLNGKLYFAAYSAAEGVELWQSDGTTAGTIMFKDINPGATTSAPENLTVSGNYIYFSANDGVNGRELWRTDGTAAGTVLVSDIVPGSGSSTPANFFYHAASQSIFFTAYTPDNGMEVWQYDGTTSRLYSEVNEGSTGSNPGPVVLAGNNLVYVGTDGTNGLELYTVKAYNAWNGNSSSNWSASSNWKNNTVPGITESVLLPYTDVVTEATLDINASVANLELSTGRILTFNTSNTLMVTNSVINNGVIRGTGTLQNANFTNAGTVAPGIGAGTLNIDGNFVNEGTIEAELGGTTAGTQYDRLAATGSVIAGGTLTVSLINGFIPVIGQSFAIITGSSVSGTFATVNWPTGVIGSVTYTANSVQLNITSILPLTLLSFKGQLENSMVKLNWQTADEINTSYFEVQRSNEGVRFTSVISNIAAAGNGNHNYTAVDAGTLATNNYYRLKMSDKDGRFTYSNTILIHAEISAGVRLSPVPAITHVDLFVTDQFLIGKKAGMYDNTGKKIMEITLQQKNTMNMAGLSSGIYFIKIENGKAIQFSKK